jgi:hypothetical protein
MAGTPTAGEICTPSRARPPLINYTRRDPGGRCGRTQRKGARRGVGSLGQGRETRRGFLTGRTVCWCSEGDGVWNKGPRPLGVCWPKP